MKKDTEVTQYIQALKPDRAKALKAIRKLIHEVASGDVTETFQYKMPTYKDANGEFLLSMASQKAGMSLYTCDGELLENYREEFSGLDLGKGCIRFKKLEQLPMDTLRTLVANTMGTG